MSEQVYRICRKCERIINVSRTERGGKQYICPACTREPWFMTRDWLCKGLKRDEGRETPWQEKARRDT